MTKKAIKTDKKCFAKKAFFVSNFVFVKFLKGHKFLLENLLENLIFLKFFFIFFVLLRKTKKVKKNFKQKKHFLYLFFIFSLYLFCKKRYRKYKENL